MFPSCSSTPTCTSRLSDEFLSDTNLLIYIALSFLAYCLHCYCYSRPSRFLRPQRSTHIHVAKADDIVDKRLIWVDAMIPLGKKDGKNLYEITSSNHVSVSTRNENDDQSAFIITNDSLAWLSKVLCTKI